MVLLGMRVRMCRMKLGSGARFRVCFVWTRVCNLVPFTGVMSACLWLDSAVA